MASGTYASQPTPPPVQPAARSAPRSVAGSYDQYVEDQLRKTRAQVKLVDIVSNGLLLICGALAYMLVVALIDHWVVTLGFWTRTLALVVLVAGCAWWAYARILPLLVRRINPVYAAYTIEQAEPSLKNSLINFLLLRGERTKVHDVVYQALGQRAASDISHVPADSVVDYNPLVRIGYVLAALVVLGAAYKILSPKDPVQSVARVMAPWADIDRATRVSIDDVRPGEAKIFQGEQIDVSAVLRGIRASDKVQVVFTTVDGQVVDQVVEMQPDSAGLRHLAKIPADEMGAQTSLHYKLVAGDAETKWYNVEVAPAPHVLVTKVHYTPPAYTKLPTEEAAHGDISGLEGTKVTLFARANREIESAYLEFDPVVEKAASASGESEARSLRITQIDGQNLQVSFQLRLADDRRTPWHKHYTIRYTSKEGHRNTRPIVHAISVKPDLAPLAEILSPGEREKTVPQNRMIEIEAKGIDLDFALSKLRLVAVSGGRDVMDVALVDSRDGQAGQVIKKLEFTPSHYALAVGDVVEYWAVAEDNRTSPRSGKPEPNVTSSTPTYRLIIGPPIIERAKPEDEEKPADGEHGEGEGSESSSGGAPQNENNNNSREPTARDESQESSESGESGQSGSSGSAQDSSGSAGGQQESEDSEGQGEGDGSQSSEGGTAGNSGSSSSEPSDSQSGESGEGGTQSSRDENQSNDAQSGGSKPSDGNSQGAGESNEPLASDGSQDGDVFEKIQQHREQQEGSGASGAQQSGDAQQQGGDAQQNSGEQNANPQNSGQQNGGNNSAGQSGNQQGEKPDGQQNGNQSGGAQSGGENQQGKQPGDNQSGGAQGGSQQGEKPQAGESGGEQQGGSQQSQEQGQKNGGQQGGEQGNQSGGQEQGAKPDQGSQSGSQQNQGGQNDQGQNKSASGGQEGGQPQGGAKPEGDKPSNQGGGQEQQNSSGGQGQNDKSGAGQESQSGGGSPESQAEKPQQKNGGEKSGGQQGGGEKKEESGKSPSGSNKSSDSQGESGGDRSGGGEQGGGQGAKKPGNDSAGSSSAGEQGDGAANEPGAGETGNRAGGDQTSDSPTGRSGEQTGEGSSTGQANDGGEKPQPKSGNQQGGDSSSSGKQPGGGRPQDGEQGEGQGEQISDTPGQGRGTMPTGGGKPADNHPSDTPLPDVEPGADAANLDYARKSTDLTLEYLKNQKHNPDPKLLDDLGWTKDDLAKFIERWDRMSRDAKTDATGASKRKLDDSLRSLGLRPRTSQVRTDDTGGTRLSNQRETGARTRPPKSYAEQYRAFSKFITPAKE